MMRSTLFLILLVVAAESCKDNWKPGNCMSRRKKGLCGTDQAILNCQKTCRLCPPPPVAADVPLAAPAAAPADAPAAAPALPYV